MKIELVERKNGEWGYRFVNKGRILNHSEGYFSKSNCERAITNFMEQVQDLVDLPFKLDESVTYLEYKD